MEGLWDMLSLRVSQVKLEHALFSDVCAEVGGFCVCVCVCSLRVEFVDVGRGWR